MTKLRGFLLTLLLLALTGGPGEAALFSGSEKKSYEWAHESFRTGLWERAEAELAEFIKEYPKSERLQQALLWQAEAAFRQKKYATTITLLQSRLAEAGTMTDQFLYWIGSAQAAETNYAAAALTFGKLAREHTGSARRLEAAVGEAAAQFKLGAWEQVTNLLRRADGAFRQAALGMTNNEAVARGYLLLGESQLALKNYPDAEFTLTSNKAGGLTGELEWKRRDLLCRTLIAQNNWSAAAAESAGLVSAAEGVQGARQLGLVAESVIFRADLLEHLQQYPEAIATLRRNLTNAPVARQRQALTRIVALQLRQGAVAAAAEELENYLGRNTNALAGDIAWLTLGELHLKQHIGRLPVEEAAVGINHLSLATNCFGTVVRNFPGSEYVGKAQLNLGWCFWVEGSFAESAAAFEAAANRLPPSEDRMVARFKLADAQFQQTQYLAALENYRAVLRQVTNWPAAEAALRGPASYQALRAGLLLTNDAVNLAGAEEALRVILTADAASREVQSSVLLVAQAFADAQQPDEAQRLFREFIAKFPDSELRPEVELLLTRMREEQGDWAAVMESYQTWLTQFPTNRLRAQVEFQLALATARSGAETNALRLFTNFVAEHANHELAPRAQWWVADHYFGQGLFGEAEIQYKQLFQNWKTSELAWEAKMMAGRAAVAWKNYENATTHFTSLTSDVNCPAALRVQALFAYGGVTMRMAPASTNKWDRLADARQVFYVIARDYATNELVAQAWGEIGNCSLQLAAGDPANYVTASNAYHRAIHIPGANVAVRSQATYGLALVLEKQAALQAGSLEATNLLKQARDFHLNIFWDKLDLAEGEQPVMYWKKNAAMDAARLSEQLGEWATAIALYRDMARLKLWPGEVVDKKIDTAEKKMRAEEKINGTGI